MPVLNPVASHCFFATTTARVGMRIEGPTCKPLFIVGTGVAVIVRVGLVVFELNQQISKFGLVLLVLTDFENYRQQEQNF